MSAFLIDDESFQLLHELEDLIMTIDSLTILMDNLDEGATSVPPEIDHLIGTEGFNPIDGAKNAAKKIGALLERLFSTKKKTEENVHKKVEKAKEAKDEFDEVDEKVESILKSSDTEKRKALLDAFQKLHRGYQIHLMADKQNLIKYRTALVTVTAKWVNNKVIERAIAFMDKLLVPDVLANKAPVPEVNVGEYLSKDIIALYRVLGFDVKVEAASVSLNPNNNPSPLRRNTTMAACGWSNKLDIKELEQICQDKELNGNINTLNAQIEAFRKKYLANANKIETNNNPKIGAAIGRLVLILNVNATLSKMYLDVYLRSQIQFETGCTYLRKLALQMVQDQEKK